MRSMTIGLVVAVMAVPVAAQGVVFDAGGFEGYTLGDLDGQFGWEGVANQGDPNTNPPQAYPPDVIDLGGEAGRVLRLRADAPGVNERNESLARLILDQDFFENPALTDVIVEFSVQVNTGADGGFQNVYFGKTYQFGNTINDGRWIRLDGGTQQLVGQFPIDEFVDVRVEYDLLNNERTLYVDGALLETVAGLGPAGTDHDADPEPDFRRWYFHNPTDNRPNENRPALTYIGDLRITAIPEPATLLLVGLAGVVVRRR